MTGFIEEVFEKGFGYMIMCRQMLLQSLAPVVYQRSTRLQQLEGLLNMELIHSRPSFPSYGLNTIFYGCGVT